MISRLPTALVVALITLPLVAEEADRLSVGARHRLRSEILDKDMELSIHLPASYSQGERRYPVLCTFQTHFPHVAGTVQSLYEAKLVPELIVVGVDSYEFGYLTPTPVEHSPGSGRADLFLRFFAEELFPHLETAYRARPYRIVFSNSWGGLFATYAVLARPEVFDAGLASIPWVLFDGEERFMIANGKRFLEAGRHERSFLFMTMDDESELLPELEAFVAVLRRHPSPGLRWEYRYWPEEDHHSTPYRTLYSGLRALYAPWSRIPDAVSEQGLEAIEEHEAALTTRFGYPIGISNTALRIAAQDLKGRGRAEEALAIFELACKRDPGRPFSWVALGRAYEEAGRLEAAIDVFRKAHALAVEQQHPQVGWVAGFVERLEEKLNAAGEPGER